jgi:UDP-N-acetylmuramyl pentapeptide phosphotransferase/UDP-N-acetylglucosamine-1-phosphate transferase
MALPDYAIPAAVSAAVVLALTPPSILALQRRGILDRPEERSSHSVPTPRGAGLITGLSLAVGLAIGFDRLRLSLAAVALIATALGALEDLHGVGVLPRLVAQVAIGAIFLACTWGLGAALAWPVAIALIFFIAGYTNAFNFMDGVNGISAAAVAVAGGSFIANGGLHSQPDLILIGVVFVVVAICFLPFNFPRARVFLGDSGSYSFGAVIACAAVAEWRWGIPPDAVLAPLAIYLADTATVIVRRAARREPLIAAHREHAFQRLVQFGFSHAQSTGVVFLGSLATALLGLAAANSQMPQRVAFDALMLGVVALYLSLPMLVAWRRRRRSAVISGSMAQRNPGPIRGSVRGGVEVCELGNDAGQRPEAMPPDHEQSAVTDGR